MRLPQTFVNESKHINAVIETPKGCAAKYNFDPETGLFRLKKILPEGMVFPFHFGFIPLTVAEDGDPVDVLVLMDEPSWPGCVIECKVLGVIQAEQKEEGKTERNDRIIAAAIESNRYKEIETLFALDSYMMDEIIIFLVTYTSFEKKDFKVIGRQGAHTAIKLIKSQIIQRKS
jgi:inorganic pyrophosphatase